MKNRPSGRGKRRGARLGQHFLTGLWAARALAKAASVRPGETILEIGPGKGALTKELLKEGRVVAIEKDEALAGILESELSSDVASGRLRIVREDIRNISPEKLLEGDYVVAANIPYYITGEIIRQFLTAKHQPRAMALLVQKEVAQRACAKDGKESLLSLSVQVYGTPSIVAKVARGNFSPPPSVDSAILRIERISRTHFENVGEEEFFRLLHAGFSSKRKLLAGNLGKKFGKENIISAFAACGIPEKARAEDVTLEKWLMLTRTLQKA